MPATAAHKQVLKFVSKALDEDALHVTSLNGVERLNQPYEFTVDLVSKDAELDFAKILEESAWIGIKQGLRTKGDTKRSATTLKIHGKVASFEQIGKTDEWTHYRALLVPGLWMAGQHKDSAIFQDVYIKDVIEDICGLYGLHYDTSKITKQGPKREYVAQYQETDLEFLNRWCEHEGIFYYFVQEDDFEKVVFADAREGYGMMQGENTFRYKPDKEAAPNQASSDADETNWLNEEFVTAITCKVSRLPKEVVLKDYNWKDPDADMLCKAPVNDKSYGTVFEYNNHYPDKADGDRLAKVRAEALKCREHFFSGEGEGRGFRAGLVFKLDEHYRGSFNQEYVITSVYHSARQATEDQKNTAEGTKYNNRFTCIPESQTFRPERVTPWPQIKGVMHGKVDGADAGTPYAQIDDMGRYKIKMGFDNYDPADGQSSKYIRKAEPNAGPNQGFHFPMLRGSEVIVTHVDGDPDRPVITGAVYNGSNPTVVSSAAHTQNRIATPGGTQMVMDDTQGATQVLLETKDSKTKMLFDATTDSEKITIQTPKNKATLDGKSGEDRIILETENSATKMRMGKSADEADRNECKHADGIRMETDGEFNTYVGKDYNIYIEGKENKKINGNSDWTWTQQCAEYKHGEWFSLKLGLTYGVSIAATADFKASAAIAITGGADMSIKLGAAIQFEAAVSLSVKKSASKEYVLDKSGIHTVKDKNESIDGKYALTTGGDASIVSQGQILIQAGVAAPPADPSVGARLAAWAAGAAMAIKNRAMGTAAPPPAPPDPPQFGPAVPTPNIAITSSSMKLMVNPSTYIELGADGITLKAGGGELKVTAAMITAKPMVTEG